MLPGVPALLLLCMVPLLCFTKETTSVTKQSEQYLNNKDYVAIEDLPKTLANANISVEYLCSGPCTVHLDVVASSEFRTGIVVFKKLWKNEKNLDQLRRRSVELKFPSSMVYRDDVLMKNSIDIYFAVVRAWVVHNLEVGTEVRHNESMFYAAAKTYAVLDINPPHQRPYKDHHICMSWLYEHLRRLEDKAIFVCPVESDAVKILSFPLASGNEHSGLTKIFEPYKNRDLERRRRQLVKYYPMFTLSIWIYLLDYCTGKECGIFHHVDTNKMYASPLLFLTSKGQIHVQLQLTTGDDIATMSKFYLPLRQWIRLDVTISRKMIILNTFLGRELESYNSHSYSLDEDIYYDDTDGYMSLGGSKYVVGIDGFFGPVKYYRLKALQMDEISNPLPEDRIYHLVEDYYSRCMHVREIVRLHTSMLHEKHDLETKCQLQNYYKDLQLKYVERPTTEMVPRTREEQNKYSNLIWLLSSNDEISWDFFSDPGVQFGKYIFEKTLKNVSHSFYHLQDSVPNLLDASCSGYHKASYLLAVMYEIGLGVPIDAAEALLYSLVGAQGDDRLALLKLGYKHLQGIDNHSLDLDVAFSYYMNVAKKTPKDQLARNAEQAFVETIRLMDEDILKEQTRENDDLFLWLKQNAERGDVHAQHRLAQMLFWGQQGVTKNTRAAIKWYERGALENEEPVVMYDYAVLLFKGDGVPKNKKMALKLMKKSAAKGQVEALNGLGWYYHSFRKDYVRAVKYWRKAYYKGNADAAFNLGVMHLHGTYPGEGSVNETQAYEFMSKASEGGHIEASISIAQYLITGILRGVQRDPTTAILLAKFVAEQNGNIGLVIRKAVNAYLDGTLDEAFLNFILTAEAGVEMSQTNVAYLCEEHLALSTAPLGDICIWRYYNLSVNQHNPSTYALLKMGDLYYYGGKNHPKDLKLSMKLYTQAALQGESQGLFNLAQLAQEGISIPEYLLRRLKIEKSLNDHSLVIELYERCQNQSSDDTISPCTLVLLYLQLTDSWHFILNSSLVRVLMSVILATLILQCLYTLQDNILQSRRVQNVHSSPRPEGNPNATPRPEQTEASVGNSFAPPHSDTRNMGLNR
ncbi:protein sel-1 homolog 3-like isoform X1 [Bufo gargarizans]|uniref:protein sel-1 homolog 3-like isoform X1 n=1 Tax=Bufo gargarizans TaxID=30331 RepID=UPI001CF39ED7|nr:protein sel-1 homolog 3-like isoform X1 [Bufo gargarizans]